MSITFDVPAIPVAQPRPRHFNGVTVSAPQKHPVNAFKAAVSIAYSQACSSEPRPGPVELHVVFVLPRVKSPQREERQLRKRANGGRYPHTKKPDVDNLLKSVVDALNGLAWIDDSQIADCSSCKVVAAGDEQPHVEITISETDTVGVF